MKLVKRGSSKLGLFSFFRESDVGGKGVCVANRSGISANKTTVFANRRAD
jgi:hypothetical protein